jgi:ribosome-binding protein aMBF1 (putative translation factor)
MQFTEKQRAGLVVLALGCVLATVSSMFNADYGWTTASTPLRQIGTAAMLFALPWIGGVLFQMVDEHFRSGAWFTAILLGVAALFSTQQDFTATFSSVSAMRGQDIQQAQMQTVRHEMKHDTIGDLERRVAAEERSVAALEQHIASLSWEGGSVGALQAKIDDMATIDVCSTAAPTEDAVRAFQARKQLKIDGVVGANTGREIDGYCRELRSARAQMEIAAHYATKQDELQAAREAMGVMQADLAKARDEAATVEKGTSATAYSNDAIVQLASFVQVVKGDVAPTAEGAHFFTNISITLTILIVSYGCFFAAGRAGVSVTELVLYPAICAFSGLVVRILRLVRILPAQSVTQHMDSWTADPHRTEVVDTLAAAMKATDAAEAASPRDPYMPTPHPRTPAEAPPMMLPQAPTTVHPSAPQPPLPTGMAHTPQSVPYTAPTQPTTVIMQERIDRSANPAVGQRMRDLRARLEAGFPQQQGAMA